MAVIFKPIQEKLTAKLEQKQLQTVLRAESLADAGAREVQAWRRNLLAQLVSDQKPDLEYIESTLDIMEQRIKEVFRAGLINIAMWSYKEATSIFISTVPRRWFRIASPVTILAGEAVDTIDIETPTEPVVGKRLGDKEWEEFVREHVFQPPSADEVNQIINEPVNGESWPSRIDKLSLLVKDKNLLAKDLVQGYSSGKTLQQLAKDLESHTKGVEASATRIARTEGLRVANKVQRKSFEQLGDLMAGEQIVATLDQNTRPEHATRNGTIYWNAIGVTPNITSMPELPDQPNCRCFPIPVLAPPKELQDDPRMAAEFANAAGQPIPAPADYIEWWRTAPEAKRKMVVGVKRYETIKRTLGREPLWPDFIDGTGQLMKIDALQKETRQQRDLRSVAVRNAINQRSQLLQQVATYGFATNLPVPKRPNQVVPPTPPKPAPKPKPDPYPTPQPTPRPEPVVPPPQPEPAPQPEPTPNPQPPTPRETELERKRREAVEKRKAAEEELAKKNAELEKLKADLEKAKKQAPPQAILPDKRTFSEEDRAAFMKQAGRAKEAQKQFDNFALSINNDRPTRKYQEWKTEVFSQAESIRNNIVKASKSDKKTAETGARLAKIDADIESSTKKVKDIGARVAVLMKQNPDYRQLRENPEFKKLNDEFNGLNESLMKLATEQRKAHEDHRLAKFEVAARYLNVKDHLKIGEVKNSTNANDAEVNDQLQQVARWTHSDNMTTKGTGVSIKTSASRRPYYNPQTGVIHLDGKSTHGLVHEFGHKIDNESGPEIRDIAYGFLNSRLRSSDKPIRVVIKGTGGIEIGCDDEFSKALALHPRMSGNSAGYAGKYYPGGITETISMGVEILFHDPVGFAEADPEYFNYVVGVLRRMGVN